MTSNDLTPEQAEQMRDAMAPMLRYLARLLRRMEARQFPPSDPLYRVATKAWDAVQHLHVHLHYLSCGSGVARKPKAPGEAPDAAAR